MSDCCKPSSLSPSTSLEERAWIRAVERLQGAPQEEKRARLDQLLSIVCGILEAALKAHPRKERTDVAPKDVSLEFLLRSLLGSLLARPEYSAIKPGLLKTFLFDSGEEATKDDSVSVERLSGTRMHGTLCDALLDSCVDLGCDFRFNGTCWLIPAPLRELVEEDCECVATPDAWDLALVALFIALVLTPIPGDEAIAGAATIARLLRLIIRARPVLVPVL